MATLLEVAASHQKRLVAESKRTARQVSLLWGRISAGALEDGWTAIAPDVEAAVTAGQVNAAGMSTAYAARALGSSSGPDVIPQAFGGVTREGRQVAPELYAAVTTTKTLIGRGMGVGQAFKAGATFMHVMAATLVRDAGRAADKTAAVGRGSLFSIRVINPGACSRCAILAGVKGHKADFKRHPGCRCTSMPLYEMDDPPEGFFTSPEDYFESLGESEQDRVFTKAGAAAIREGADPIKVVNARRGALTSTKRPDGTFSPARLQKVTIGRKADGTPLQVYATREGTTARSAWARQQGNLTKFGDERYRRTTTLRLMPEQIMQMSSDPARIRELLQQYGYMN